MRLTIRELDRLQSVDIGAVDPAMLPDAGSVALNAALPKETACPVWYRQESIPTASASAVSALRLNFQRMGHPYRTHWQRFFSVLKAGDNIVPACRFETG